MMIGLWGCGDGTTIVEPPQPGQITLTTETQGFLPDDGYELVVNGENRGAIGANDQATVPSLEPATYEVSLGDVAENCSVDAAEVEVLAGETAEVTLTVVCDFGAATSYVVRYSRERPNLDIEEVVECPFGICSTNEGWDLYAYDQLIGSPRSIIRQNQTTGAEIAHLTGVTLDGLTEADVEGATFTTDLVSETFDTGRVILIRSDTGAIYALGNPVEDTTALTLTFDAVLLVVGS